MEQFPEASELPRIYSLEGHEGKWNQAKYAEAKKNPSAVRAIKKNTVAWFLPVVKGESLEPIELEDLSGLGAEETGE